MITVPYRIYWGPVQWADCYRPRCVAAGHDPTSCEEHQALIDEGAALHAKRLDEAVERNKANGYDQDALHLRRGNFDHEYDVRRISSTARCSCGWTGPDDDATPLKTWEDEHWTPGGYAPRYPHDSSADV